jgi:hypothetical protein
LQLLLYFERLPVIPQRSGESVVEPRDSNPINLQNKRHGRIAMENHRNPSAPSVM